MRQVLSGRVVNSYECMMTQLFWSDATNWVDANRDRFWKDFIKSLSYYQDDVRGVMLEHLKFEMIEQGQTPTEELERFEDFCRFLEVVGGTTPIPTVPQKPPFILSSFQSHGGRSPRWSRGTQPTARRT